MNEKRTRICFDAQKLVEKYFIQWPIVVDFFSFFSLFAEGERVPMTRLTSEVFTQFLYFCFCFSLFFSS